MGAERLEIDGSETVAVPAAVVWRVLTDVDVYPEWNPFVLTCRTSWKVGTPIVMKVRLTPRTTIRQSETIRRYDDGRLIEYGIDLPGGLLSSARRHVVTAVDDTTTRYDSEFVLSGRLAPLVRRLLGMHLGRGFGDMTAAVARRAEQVGASG
jgi:uncharacterized protein YndB with AHSA1/START domain